MSDKSSYVIAALDKIAHAVASSAPKPRPDVIAALNNIAAAVASSPTPTSPASVDFSIGPSDEVLLFSATGTTTLTLESPTSAYFHLIGGLTDLNGSVKGTTWESIFPFNPEAAGAGLTVWPSAGPPFNEPPVSSADAEPVGYTKTNLFFSDGSTLVTVGATNIKLSLLQGEGAQLWYVNWGTVAGGTGKYEGAQGVLTVGGSAFFAIAPEILPEPAAILLNGFPGKLLMSVSIVPQNALGSPPAA